MAAIRSDPAKRTPQLQTSGNEIPIGGKSNSLTHAYSTGIYCNGAEQGFQIFQGAVDRLHEGYRDRIRWMKLSEMARYWAAKELTEISIDENGRATFRAPYGEQHFTIKYRPLGQSSAPPQYGKTPLQRVPGRTGLKSGTWCDVGQDRLACFNLTKGESMLSL